MIIIVCLGIIATVFFGDQWIKNRIEQMEERHTTAVTDVAKEYFDGRIKIRKYHNRGAMLNLGQHHQKVVAALSVVLSVAAIVVFLFSLGRKGNNLMRVGMALLLGGAFSNTYDRLKRKYVVDYVSFGVRKWRKSTPLGEDTPRRKNTPWRKDTPWRKNSFGKWFENIVFNISDFCIMIGAVLTAFSS